MKNRRSIAITVAALAVALPVFSAQPQLKYVVILSRHGVRSPTWNASRLNQYSAEPWPSWGVPPGDLTPHGRDLIKILGSYYGEWLASEHLLNRGNCQDANRVYIWADTDQRTLETGRAFAESVLPGCGIPTHSRSGGGKDPLFSGSAASDPRAGADAVRQRLDSDPQKLVRDHREALNLLQFILTGGREAPRKLLESPPQVAAIVQAGGVELQGPFSAASSLSEDLLLEYANGMQGSTLGWGRLTPESLFQVLELHRVYADLMRRTSYLAKARSANLLNHILASMEQASSGKAVPGALGDPGTTVLILAGHDTNQSNISGILNLSWSFPGYQPDETPPGGALIFSLWRDADDRHDLVRLEYLAASLDDMRNSTKLTMRSPPMRQQIPVAGCKTELREPGCTLQQFRASIQN